VTPPVAAAIRCGHGVGARASDGLAEAGAVWPGKPRCGRHGVGRVSFVLFFVGSAGVGIEPCASRLEMWVPHVGLRGESRRRTIHSILIVGFE